MAQRLAQGFVVGGPPGAIMAAWFEGAKYGVSTISNSLQEQHGWIFPGQATYASCGFVHVVVPQNTGKQKIGYHIRTNVDGAPWEDAKIDCWDCGPGNGFYIMQSAERVSTKVKLVWDPKEKNIKEEIVEEPSWLYMAKVRSWEKGTQKEFKISVTYELPQ